MDHRTVRRSRLTGLLLVIAIAAGSCGFGGSEVGETEGAFHPDGWDGAELAPLELYDPVEAGEQTPNGFRQLLNRDAIFPVYRPTFLRADEIDWPDNEAVIGVDLEGEARAYPVGFLNRREIVVDIHRGIPTFVTW